MFSRILIKHRQFAALAFIVAGFLFLGWLAIESLSTVQDTTTELENLYTQQVLAGDIDIVLENTQFTLERMALTPANASEHSATLRSTLLEAERGIEELQEISVDNPIIAILETGLDDLIQSVDNALIPIIGTTPLDEISLVNNISQRQESARSLRGQIQQIEQRLLVDIAQQNEDTEATVASARLRIVVAIGSLAVLVAGLSLSNVLAITSGLNILRDGATRLAQNQLSSSIDFGRRRDEFSELGDNFNVMADAIRSQRIAIQQQIRELEDARAKAERATELKSVYLANMSHELRAPMHIILNFTKLVADGELGQITEQQEHSLRRVIMSSENLLTVINDLLDIARIEAGQLEIRAEDFDLCQFADEMIGSTEALLSQAEKTDRVKASMVGDPASPLMVHADPVRVRQIMINLLSNAVRFTDKGHIHLSFGLGKDSVTVCVEDTGVGIPKDKQAAIFGRFQQAHYEPQRGGTGLGLAIAQELVVLQGGRMWLTSEAGQGSAFYFTLPLAGTATAQAANSTQNPIAAS